MSSPLQYKVYVKIKGETKRTYLANFRSRVDSINYAFSCSSGRYRSLPDASLLAYDLDGKILVKYVQGVRTGGKL